MHKVPTGRLHPCQLQMLPCYLKEATYDRNMKILLNCSIFPLEKERGLSSFWTIVSLCSSKIKLEIMLTPTNKSHGFFMCPSWLLKCSRHITSAPLATLINNSVQRGIFPSKLKHATIILINGRTRDPGPGTYCPISLLSVFNRLFEKIMYNHVKSFFSKHCLFYESQYGFRKQRSTKHALLDIVNKIQSNLDEGMFSCDVFIDFPKAFYTTNHSTFINYPITASMVYLTIVSPPICRTESRPPK